MIFVDIKGTIDTEQNRVWMELWGQPGQVCSVESIRKVLKDNPDDPDICLNIDCQGGDVEEGFKIYDELRNSGKNIYSNITGGCHSMAVCILLAAPPENRSANRNCRALIHKVYAPVYDWLNADDATDIANMLQLEEEAILDIYVERTGTDRGILKNVMDQEKVHSAKSLLELGFISKINSYNTNQYFNKLYNMAEKSKSNAFQAFMDKVNAFKNKKAGKSANFDYLDADGNVVLSTVGDEDNLAEGVEATLASGETSGIVTLEDGRVVTVTDNVVTDIEVPDEENLEERVAQLESLLEEATNLAQEQENTINELRTELNNYKGSNYNPKPRKTNVPGNKKADLSKDELKAAARQMQAKVNQAKIIKKQ